MHCRPRDNGDHGKKPDLALPLIFDQPRLSNCNIGTLQFYSTGNRLNVKIERR